MPASVPDILDDEMPRVTATHLRRAATLCSLRLAKEHANKRGARLPGVGFEVANRVTSDARQAHSEMRVATPADFPAPRDLAIEQQRLYSAAAAWYVTLFGSTPARVAEVDEWSIPDAETGTTIVGQVGIAVDLSDGGAEVRSLSVARTARPPDSTQRAFVVLRVGAWTAGRPLTVVWADLVGGSVTSAVLDPREELARARDLYSERLTIIRRRIASATPEPGQDCATCRFVAECGAHR